MLGQIKLALRLTNNTFDSQIEALVAACKADLAVAGVIHIKDNDPLLLHAVTLFCRANFDTVIAGEKYLQVYESLKTPLRLAGELSGGGTAV